MMMNKLISIILACLSFLFFMVSLVSARPCCTGDCRGCSDDSNYYCVEEVLTPSCVPCDGFTFSTTACVACPALYSFCSTTFPCDACGEDLTCKDGLCVPGAETCDEAKDSSANPYCAGINPSKPFCCPDGDCKVSCTPVACIIDANCDYLGAGWGDEYDCGESGGNTIMRSYSYYKCLSGGVCSNSLTTEWGATETICSGKENDRCNDYSTCKNRCFNTVDNDGDGLLDSADPDCSATPPSCVASPCSDSLCDENPCDGCTDQCSGGGVVPPVSIPEVIVSGNCLDGVDNDFDGKCDYDSSRCSHGDEGCPVSITSISVDNPNPCPPNNLIISCGVSVPGVNSIGASLNGVDCAWLGWQGSVARFSCPTSGRSVQQALCFVQASKSYQSGINPSVNVNVGLCPWCPVPEACTDCIDNDCDSLVDGNDGSDCPEGSGCSFDSPIRGCLDGLNNDADAELLIDVDCGGCCDLCKAPFVFDAGKSLWSAVPGVSCGSIVMSDWDEGTTPYCCGDDAKEFFKVSPTNSSRYACCNSSASCVDNFEGKVGCENVQQFLKPDIDNSLFRQAPARFIKKS